MSDETTFFDNDWRVFPTVSRDQWLQEFLKAKLPDNESLTRQQQGVVFSAVNTQEQLPPIEPTPRGRLSPPSCILEERVVDAPTHQAIAAQLQSGVSGFQGTNRPMAPLVAYANQHPGSIRSLSLDAEHTTTDDLLQFIDQFRQLSEPTPLAGTVYLPSTTWDYWQKQANNSTIDCTVKLFAAAEEVPSLRVLPLRGDAFHALGATVINELAMVLSWFATYCDLLTDEGVAISTILARTEITLATGSDFFIDLAKFRAVRELVGKMAEAYGLEGYLGTAQISVRAVSGTINKTHYDADSNILRNTTEALAALLGGANSLALLPHDFLYPAPSAFGKQTATQVYNLLRHEGQVDRVHDPAAGSYFLEDITRQVVEKSWERFLQMEEEGGFLTLLQNGALVAQCQQEAAEQLKQVRTQRKVLVGTTRYVNPQEVISGDFTSINVLFSNQETLRWAIPYERLRATLDQQVAQGHIRPTLQLWVQQDATAVAFINQRVHYVKDLLASTGIAYEVMAWAKTIDIRSATFAKRHQLGFVACGTDDFYTTTVADMLREGNLSASCRWIAGGATATVDTVRQAGGNGVLGIGHDVIALIEQTTNQWHHEA